MRAFDLDQMRAVHLFEGMDETQFAGLMHAAYLQRFPAHVVLIDETEKPDFLHVVVDGAVEIFSRHDGRETTITIIQPVTTFILAAVVGDLPYLASGRTLQPSRVLMIPAEAVRTVFERDAKFARAVVWELARGYRGVMKELKNQKLRTGIERLANWVLRQAEANDNQFRLPFDKRTLAARLGMTPENLSRHWSALAAHGVTVRGRDVSVGNRRRLADMAKPSPTIDDPDY